MRNKFICVVVVVLSMLMLLPSCGEYNKILKSSDQELKYTYAKKYFDEGKYGRSSTLLQEVLTPYTGTSYEEEILFLLAQSYLYNKDYVSAHGAYVRYYKKYTRGAYTELARFNAAYSLYLDIPEIRLDQSNTINAIAGFQDYLEYHSDGDKANQALDYMFELQERLAEKELYSCQLYLDMGLYMGNNYESCVVTAREALKSYPFSKYIEEYQILILRAKFEQAELSYDERKPIRYREVMDEYFNYINMFTDGKHLKESTKYYQKALKELGQDEDKLQEEVDKVNS